MLYLMYAKYGPLFHIWNIGGDNILQDTNAFSSLKPLLVLEVLAKKNDWIGVSEICSTTNLSKSTVHRLLAELVACNYVQKNDSIKKYKLGLKLLCLAGNATQSPLVLASKEEMKQLNNKFKETLHLVMEDHFEGVYIQKIDTSYSLGLMSYIGKKVPLYCSGAGKCILAFSEPQYFETYIQNVSLEKFTPNTICTRKGLEEELAKIRSCGYAFDANEHKLDISCVAGPVFDNNGRIVAGLSIAGPSYRMKEYDSAGMGEAIKQACSRITQKLSY